MTLSYNLFYKLPFSYVASPTSIVKKVIPKINEFDAEWLSFAKDRRISYEAESPLKNNNIDEVYGTDITFNDEMYDNKNCFMRSGYFIKKLSKLLPKDKIIFDEALTNSPPIGKYIPGIKPGDRMLTRGGSLGTGFPGAIGAKLAFPEKTVIGFSGDGGSMYTIQCLWTASRHAIKAKFIVCQNRSYRLLQANISKFWSERGIDDREYPIAFDLSKPEICFANIALSFGVKAERVYKPSQVEAAIIRMLEHDGPYLINLVLDGDIHPELIGVRCGQ